MRVLLTMIGCALLVAVWAMKGCETVDATVPVLVGSASEHPESGGREQPSRMGMIPSPLDLPMRRMFDSSLQEQGPEPCRTFDSLIQAMITLGMRMRRAVEQGQAGVAMALNPRAQDLLLEMDRCVPNPEERSLFWLTGLASTSPEPEAGIRRSLCLHFIAAGLDRRWRHREQDGQSFEHLVSSVLGCVTQDEELAQDLGMGLLAGAPFLGAAHEAQVLDIATLSAERPFLVPVAAALLLTLWENLEEAGVRSSGEVASLALLLMEGTNPGCRLAALEFLLLGGEGRFTELAVREIIDRGDEEEACWLASSAAHKMEPRQAVELLESLAAVAGRGLTAAFLVLADRAPQILVAAYDRHLAGDSSPSLRAALVTGVGFRGQARGIDLARLAFGQDPDPGVRSRAMFVLTACAGTSLGEEVLMSALDDPVMGHDASHLGQIALALENLEDTAKSDAIDRVARQILKREELLAGDRERLVQWLARVMPGHWTGRRRE